MSVANVFVWRRDQSKVKQIKHARTPQELIDLVTIVSGLGEDVWQKRMSEFGPEVLPLISERLRTVKQTCKEENLDMVYEQLITNLRWRGAGGAEVLLERFDGLNDYGKNLACVVLGLLEVQSSADRMWAFYQKVDRNRQRSYLVGALWGLIHLRDERVSGALIDRLRQKHVFYEMFGFFALAGDIHTVQPLMWAVDRLSRDDRADPLMALVSVAHRIGRESLITELAKIASPNESRETQEIAVDEILSHPTSQAEKHFELFYQGFELVDEK
ncbi:MAG: hypothetical protein GY832_25385 [Chloroflexi bacterium]|nr:hypothetical protein [Chloroflexota bacterium]